jgi:hypothetical protein
MVDLGLLITAFILRRKNEYYRRQFDKSTGAISIRAVF